ncbi:hypothetical protein COCMIDRAFT_1752 [Bipolaris oryzae ATCC 44560]|uniref:Myb-like domain-containing protein n=1 Tax=Bipolaris oryzae ATCC 44560 TaxID=930090 RepID=W7A0E7_COCMI|nr:uncharacterized protein COCMIDRAFT_1752 [Bipolaris oryzae ATCC 44560]EUC49501.1 hypothetical protein COCMIDRAFT_1752 [Bipolaris oryzae ATCC 44560]
MPAAKNKSSETDVSGKRWTDDEKLAYLLVLCGHEGGLQAKIKSAPKPAGRTKIACKRMIERLEEQFEQEIASMKNAQTSNG